MSAPSFLFHHCDPGLHFCQSIIILQSLDKNADQGVTGEIFFMDEKISLEFYEEPQAEVVSETKRCGPFER